MSKTKINNKNEAPQACSEYHKVNILNKNISKKNNTIATATAITKKSTEIT